MKFYFYNLVFKGGAIMQISGTGFSKDCKVTVGTNDCLIISSTYSLIKCLIPSNVNSLHILIKINNFYNLSFKPTQSNLTVNVIVTNNGTTSNTLNFLYDADHTPVVSDITPKILSVMGKMKLRKFKKFIF